MDAALLALALSACLSLVVYIILVTFLRKKNPDKYGEDRPQGPITIG